MLHVIFKLFALLRSVPIFQKLQVHVFVNDQF